MGVNFVKSFTKIYLLGYSLRHPFAFLNIFFSFFPIFSSKIAMNFSSSIGFDPPMLTALQGATGEMLSEIDWLMRFEGFLGITSISQLLSTMSSI